MNIYDFLRCRYPSPEWAMFHEVNTGNGYGDAIVINMWSSRGYCVHGFELKSSRGDWLRELKKPEKAEGLFRYCDFWWLLTEEESISKKEEIPIGWGWVTAKGERLKTIIAAPKLKPKPLDRWFIAAVLRRANEQMNKLIHPDEIKDKIEEAYKKGEESKNYNQKREIERLKEIEEDVKLFEKASGIKIASEWKYSNHDAKKTGEAVRFLLLGGVERSKKDLIELKERSDRISKYLKEQLDFYEPKKVESNGEGIQA